MTEFEHRARSRPGAVAERKNIENHMFFHLLDNAKSLKSLQESSNSCLSHLIYCGTAVKLNISFWCPRLTPKWSQNGHGRRPKQGLEKHQFFDRKTDPKWCPKMLQKRPGTVSKRALGKLWALLGGPRAPKEPQDSEKVLKRFLHGTKMVRTDPNIRPKPRRRPRASCS